LFGIALSKNERKGEDFRRLDEAILPRKEIDKGRKPNKSLTKNRGTNLIAFYYL
jgi:hypothetical protein